MPNGRIKGSNNYSTIFSKLPNLWNYPAFMSTLSQKSLPQISCLRYFPSTDNCTSQ